MPQSDLIVDLFDGAAAEWDAVLEAHGDSTFCHRHPWREVMEEALGHETFFLVARDSATGRASGVLPLVRVRSRLFGDYLVSMPFLNYGGAIGTDAACLALVRAATRRAKELGVDLLELRMRSGLPGTGLVESVRKLTVIKSLPDSPEELWEKGIKAKVRSQIRRPMKEGMELRFGGDLLEPFYDVFSTTMRDLGTPVLPIGFFRAIKTSFPDSSLFAVVEWRGRPLAAGCGLFWNGEFEITWAGSSREHARQAPNMLLYWGMMEECVRQGANAFNFGRCSPDSGTHKFKKQWGAEDHPLPWLQWSPSGVPSTPSPDSPKFRAATNVWSRLPVGVTNVIGPRVSRVIP